MPDMLVKLYALPPLEPLINTQQASGVTIRRVIAPEKLVITRWVGANFGDLWQSECDVSFNFQPPTCFIATEAGKLLGFACYDTTKRGFFGPTGVDKSTRGRGIGAALLLICLHDMWAQGYGYAIIGAAGPTEFYKKIVGAVEIEDSWPGVYAGLLNNDDT